MTPLQETMQRAMRLMRTGDLRAATGAIQHALAGEAPHARNTSDDSRNDENTRHGDASQSPIIDVEFRVLDDNAERPGEPDRGRDERAARTARPDRDGGHAFESLAFRCKAGHIEYKLYIPPGLDTTSAPLLLMLHGCTQSPDDFARGTRMNELALAHGYVVAYPAQTNRRNPNKCWNWFRPGDQQRDRGEPGMLAALTRELVATHSLDASRVYVAGLSAGGAMASILAGEYPELYAAIGVHSGLPTGRAHDVASAFSAMRSAADVEGNASIGAATAAPAIVFHGERDSTVHPGNADGVVAQAMANGDVADTISERGTSKGGREYTRISHRRKDGSVQAELWLVRGAGHAWSGGNRAGSYTDPEGPDASAEMLRFFSMQSNARAARAPEPS